MPLVLIFLFSIQQVASSQVSSSNDTIRLFNGKNLDNWYVFLRDRGVNNDPKQVFSVTPDGLLKITGEEWGCITTNDEFRDYRIILEYKWGEKTHGSRETKARDSGLLFHSKGKDGGYSNTWMHSIECNIIEGGTGDFIVVGDGTDKFSATSLVAPEKQNGQYIHHPYGTPATINRGRINWAFRDPGWEDKKDFRGKYDVENPVGSWNILECHLENGEALIYLNGRLINHATRVVPDEGRIQIQSEGAELFIRRVDIVPNVCL